MGYLSGWTLEGKHRLERRHEAVSSGLTRMTPIGDLGYFDSVDLVDLAFCTVVQLLLLY